MARLAQRVRVDVLDAPGKVGRRAVMLAVDDVPDAADREADHRRRSGGVHDLPEGERGAPSPDISAHHRSEQTAPLADATLGDEEDPGQLARKKLEVLPHVKKAGPDQSHYHHPRDPVRACLLYTSDAADE